MTILQKKCTSTSDCNPYLTISSMVELMYIKGDLLYSKSFIYFTA